MTKKEQKTINTYADTIRGIVSQIIGARAEERKGLKGFDPLLTPAKKREKEDRLVEMKGQIEGLYMALTVVEPLRKVYKPRTGEAGNIKKGENK